LVVTEAAMVGNSTIAELTIVVDET
jgi:hypothetical protein